jgi:hypothetical protein
MIHPYIAQSPENHQYHYYEQRCRGISQWRLSARIQPVDRVTVRVGVFVEGLRVKPVSRPRIQAIEASSVGVELNPDARRPCPELVVRPALWQPMRGMSTQEIMAELTKLSREDLEQLDARLHDLLQRSPEPSSRTWADALRDVAGSARDLPADLAHNHDHYLHGAPRR